MNSEGNITPKYYFLCICSWILFALRMRNKYSKTEVKKKKTKKALNLKAKFCHRIIVLILFILTNCKVSNCHLIWQSF